MSKQKWIVDLPKLLVPNLRTTLDAYLYALEPILLPKKSLNLLNKFTDSNKKITSLIGSSLTNEKLIKLSKQYENTCNLVDEFAKKEGKVLQEDLVKYNESHENWAHDFWVNDVFLANRLSLIEISAGFQFPRVKFETTAQMLLYACKLIEFTIDYKNAIDNQTLEQDFGFSSRSRQPLCMSSYKSFFHSYRMPGEHCDILEEQPLNSNHIIVASCDQFYALKLYHNNDKDSMLSTNELFEQLMQIYLMSRKLARETEVPKVGLLTAAERNIWAQNVEKITLKNSDNKFTKLNINNYTTLFEDFNSFELIKSSLFILCLDSMPTNTDEDIIYCQDYNNNNENKKQALLDSWKRICKNEDDDYSSEYDSKLKTLSPKFDIIYYDRFVSIGGGSSKYSANRWHDKFLNLIVARDGYCGLSMEHSVVETPPITRFASEFRKHLAKTYSDDCQLLFKQNNSLVQIDDDKKLKQNNISKLLQWNIDNELSLVIDNCAQLVDKFTKSNELIQVIYKLFGFKLIKSYCLSPDAFVQMALLYSYYKLTGCYPISYEACTLRHFKFGRDGSIRQHSLESLAWIQAMLHLKKYKNNCANDETNDEIETEYKFQLINRAKSLLKLATSKQTELTKNSINGNSTELHLTVLNDLAKIRFGDNMPKFFTDKTYEQFLTHNFVTSQITKDANMLTEAGTTYMTDNQVFIATYNIKENSIFMIQSCIKQSHGLNNQAFAKALVESFDEMHYILIHNN